MARLTPTRTIRRLISQHVQQLDAPKSCAEPFMLRRLCHSFSVTARRLDRSCDLRLHCPIGFGRTDNAASMDIPTVPRNSILRRAHRSLHRAPEWRESMAWNMTGRPSCGPSHPCYLEDPDSQYESPLPIGTVVGVVCLCIHVPTF